MMNFKRILAHRFGNLVMLARNSAEMLEEPDLLPAQREQLRGVLVESMERMEQIIRDVADLGRAETLHEEPKRHVDMAMLVEQVLARYQDDAQAAGLALEFVIQQSPPHDLYLQADLVKRALGELIRNAIRFTREGQVDVALTTSGEYVVVQVADTGIGIPSDQYERIFAPFYRVKDPFVAVLPGNGMGLAVAQAVIEAHGGDLAVESETGTGSVFTLRLPLQIVMA